MTKCLEKLRNTQVRIYTSTPRVQRKIHLEHPAVDGIYRKWPSLICIGQ